VLRAVRALSPPAWAQRLACHFSACRHAAQQKRRLRRLSHLAQVFWSSLAYLDRTKAWPQQLLLVLMTGLYILYPGWCQVSYMQPCATVCTCQYACARLTRPGQSPPDKGRETTFPHRPRSPSSRAIPWTMAVGPTLSSRRRRAPTGWRTWWASLITAPDTPASLLALPAAGPLAL
jgi:hypothetical protein